MSHHHRTVSRIPSTARSSKAAPEAPKDLVLEAAHDPASRRTAIEQVVKAVHDARATIGRGTITGRMQRAVGGPVTITGRMCGHSDSIKLGIDGPGGHREVCVPWKRGHEEGVTNAATALKEVSEKREPALCAKAS